jgi:uncharacterized protein YbaP (TraB family)
MLRTCLPLLTALLAHVLSAQQAPEKLKGLLWEISGNGIAKTGYLYGTMHVPEKLAFNLSDSFFVALRRADVLALETDHDRWQEFTEMLHGRESELFNPNYSGYGGTEAANQPNLYDAQFEFKSPDNQLLGAMLSAKPRMTNEFLYRSNQYRQDYEEDTYLDLFIFQAGRKLGKTVIGLETLEGSYEALVRAQIPDDEPEDADRHYYPSPATRTSLEDAYRDQDLSLLDSLNKMMRPGKNFQRWMLDERNHVMEQRIDSILQSGTGLFAAVGAAHLPGEYGLIRLLREKGYTLRPVQFSSAFSKQEKEAIEALRYPVQLSRQWSPDASWSVEAPGKFFQTMDGAGLEELLCTDMSNGAYYAVYRLLTFGLWNGQPAQYIADRIDSLLYEKIPGKIIDRKRFQTPFPGHEITTRTRRGDLLRYKIIITPMEALLFATGANGDYAAGEEGARFINSIQLHGPGNAHKTAFEPEHGGFRVDLPAPLLLNTSADREADHFLVAAQDPADSAFYMVFRADYHDWDFIEEDTFELNIIGERLAAQFTKRPAQQNLVSPNPYPTQDITFRSDRDSAWYFLRLVINGPHYYLLGCRKYNPAPPVDFLNSFSITPVRYPQGWQLLRDSSMLFESPAPLAAILPQQPFLEKLQRIIREGFQKNNRRKAYPETGLLRQMRVLELPVQGEKISIQAMELLSTGSPTPVLDSFKIFTLRRLTKRNGMAVRSQHWNQASDRLLTGDFLLEDTNSTRGIRTKVFLTPGRMYVLSATTHLEGLPGAFTDTVFNAFTPTDTTAGVLPFGRRNLDFLQEIYAPDSLIRHKALSRLEAVWRQSFEAGDFPAIRAAIEHPQFGRLRFENRETLLGHLGQFNTPEALWFVLNFGLRHADSLRYQQILLPVLAEMQTRPAHQALLLLLKQDDKYVSGSAISAIFDALQDSLNLSAPLLPELLALSGQEEFRKPVIRLLDAAVRQHLIKPKQYARLKPFLIRESFRQLGRQQLLAEARPDAQYRDGSRYEDYPAPYEKMVDLRQNLRLLAPFLLRDKAVQSLFGLAARTTDADIRVMAQCLMLREGLPVQKEALHALAASDRTRYMLHQCLAETGQLAPYKAWFADTVALIRSMLTEELASRSEANSREDTDSIRFISRHRTLRWNNPATIYFFDLKRKKEKDWQLAFVTVPDGLEMAGGQTQKGDAGAVSSFHTYRMRPEIRVMPDLDEKEKSAFIREKIGEIRFANRKRYQNRDGREDYYYFE